MTSEMPETIIPKNIIETMVEECNGDKVEVLAKCLCYVKDNEADIRMSLFYAKKGLLRVNRRLQNIKEDNKKSLKEIENICATAKLFQECLQALPDIRNLNESSTWALERHFELALYKYEPNSIGMDIPTHKHLINNWEEFRDCLDDYILLFEEVKASLGSLKKVKTGEDPFLPLLEPYITHLAHMYQYATGEPFKFNGNGAASHGMRFAERGMKAIYLYLGQTGTNSFNDGDFVEYSNANFKNACRFVDEEIRNNNVISISYDEVKNH